MKLKWFCGLVLTVLVAGANVDAKADAGVASRYVDDAREVGRSRLVYLFWPVYDAVLYAPAGRWRSDGAFALSLTYLRDLKGKDIARRTIEEMQGQGYDNMAQMREWQARLEQVFPDVSNGTRLLGVRDKEGRTRFFMGSRLLGQFDDPEFARRFFSIWLGEKSSEPLMRKELLGIAR